MNYYSEVCDKFSKPKSKCKQFKSNRHEEFIKCKHMELTIENLDINNVDEVFYAYIIEHNEEFDYYRIKCHFKLVLNDNQYSTNVRANLIDNKTMISWQNFLKNVIEYFKNRGYNFKHIEQMNNITIGYKLDMSYDFCTKQNVHAVE